MASRIKHLTSGKRRRFNEGGFDLDLTYIKPDIVAMGLPIDRFEGIYRNHINEVIRFFDERHSNHYKIYNLCSESSYDPSKFHQRVSTYPFENENPPPFELIAPFCEDLEEWLRADDHNVGGIHCDNGLGRTGVMICSYLLHDRRFHSAKDALQFFAEARTQNARGVTIPSQRRYVQYYGHLLKNNLRYSPKTLLIHGIKLIGIPSIQGGTCAPYFTVLVQKVKIYASKVYEHIKKTDKAADFLLPQGLPLCGDIKINFYHQSTIGKLKKMFSIWFNTFFIDMHLMQQGLAHPKTVTQSTKFSEVLKNETYTDIPTSITTLHKKSKVNQFTYRKVEPQSRRLKGALKKAGKKAGVDITTGVTVLLSTPHKATSKENAKQSPVPISLDEAFDTTNSNIIVLPQSELDKAHKDKKHYPANFQVHLYFSSEVQRHNIDLNVDYSSEDNDTDISDTDTDDEDIWDRPVFTI